ncbi:hypothetical protein H5410_062504 [Solanum commersonii]|uniref:Uncharacterized protein n=1 Tax=Solanum commersonii TaxID=4109 RepID=A0A9J5WB03_SOLCO|nr:hypothetical protein H5410_062504 [Solanum commersonii]
MVNQELHDYFISYVAFKDVCHSNGLPYHLNISILVIKSTVMEYMEELRGNTIHSLLSWENISFIVAFQKQETWTTSTSIHMRNQDLRRELTSHVIQVQDSKNQNKANILEKTLFIESGTHSQTIKIKGCIG